MVTCLRPLCWLLLPLAVLLVPPRAGAQTTADLFDSQTLQEVRLFVNSRDLQELRSHYDEDHYYPADFLWRGIRVRNVGVRVRGLATRSAVKPGLKIEFDHYVAGQTLLGLQSLILDNALKDPSFLRDRTAMALIARMGQPATRESFGRLYINNWYQGVYTLVEPVDAAFLARTLGENSGYLFEYKYVAPYFAEDLGELEAYKPRFEPRTRRLEADGVLYGPIQALFREVNLPVDGIWRDRVSQYIDLPQLVAHVAVETFLTEADGFLGTAGMANFYLYRPVGSNRHRLLAWDRDTTFQDIGAPIFARVGENALFSRALAFDDLRAIYLKTLERCAQLAAADRWLEREVASMSDLIRSSVYEDESKQFSNDAYDQDVAFLQDFARLRPALVIEAVADVRAGSAASRR